MRIPYYHVDAFTGAPFSGNPAGVCVLSEWPADRVLQQVAAEHNLSETAFLVAEEGYAYRLRWFTPQMEVDLCGHATLASAHVLFTAVHPALAAAQFDTRSGRLTVTRSAGLLTLDFPARPAAACVAPPALLAGLGRAPRAVLRARDYLAIYDHEDEVRGLTPDFAALATLSECLGIIATARGVQVDFVSRFFAPRAGINEDPVTGSAHCTLIPYWSARLEKNALHALQVSPRGGELWLHDHGPRVHIAGHAVTYMTGVIEV